MRGKVDEVHEMKDNVRITPAYAGKSSCPLIQMLFAWDHPRLCGEKVKKNTLTDSKKGSPPPMRGKV